MGSRVSSAGAFSWWSSRNRAPGRSKPRRTALLQLGQVADGRVVVELVAPLTGPLPEGGKVVVLPDQVRLMARGSNLEKRRRADHLP